MKTSAASISLQSELEGLIVDIHLGENFTCLGKSRKGEQCGNSLKKDTRDRLTKLFEKIVKILASSDIDVEKLLAEASSLVMCVQRHQNQASAKLKEWLGMIPGRKCELGDKLPSSPAPDLSTGLTGDGILSRKQQNELKNTVEDQDFEQALDSRSTWSSLKPDIDDSGWESDNEDDLFSNETGPSRIITAAVLPSSTMYRAPQTPQKAAKTVSTDSGISMSYDTLDETSQTRRLIEHRDIPESPLTDKVSKAKRGIAKVQASRPAPTPLQPISLSIRPKRKFAPFDDPFTKMRKYITKPLGKEDMKDGYIYGFQLEGCAYTKIGLAADRETEPSVEASLAARIKEHKRSGWPDLQIVLEKKVPHVKRVEKIIHYHLEAGWMKEQCSCRRSNGREFGNGNHTEWFNNSLDEIYTVVIAWEHWILSMPYVELEGGMHHLSPKWKSYLGEIGGFQNGRDRWLEWLCQYVPELPRAIIKDTLETNEWIESDITAGGQRSFVRNSAAGLKSEIKRTKTNFL